MDKSETYIKMCEKAEEIQGLWRPAIGDYYYRHATNEREHSAIVMVDTLKKNHFGILAQLPNIWLPRQDQLQEMLGLPINQLLYDFVLYCEKDVFGIFKAWKSRCYSMEQLWLAFYLRQQYDKVWNGENWVKEENK